MKASLLIVMIVAPLLISVGRQTNGTPGAGYTWSLGSLATPVDYSSRFDVDWDHSGWADGYDTEAELNARGWSTVDITEATSGITCAAGGSGSSEDESGFLAVLTANCTTDSDGAGGSGPLACNNVFKIAADCTIDVMAGSGNDASTPAVFAPYSNFAIVGADADTSRIYANDTIATATESLAPLFGNYNSWPNRSGSSGTPATWVSGTDDGTKGDTTVTASGGSCTGLGFDYDDGTDDATDPSHLEDESSLINVYGLDEDGQAMRYQTKVAGSTGSTGSTCTLTLTEPLPSTFTTLGSITEIGPNRTQHNILLDLTMGFPYVAEGICSGEGAVSTACATGVKLFGAENVLIDGVTIGPHGNQAVGMYAAYQVVIRHSTMGPNLHTLRRPNNSGTITMDAGGSLLSVYDNAFLKGAIRMNISADAAMFAYYGFNWWIDQTPTTVGEGGNYCDGISGAVGFPVAGSGPERTFYINHDEAHGIFAAPDGGGISVGRFLIETNDSKCSFSESLDKQRTLRYSTLYRNRFIGQDPDITVSTSANESNYYAFIGNRASVWNIGSGMLDNVLGLFNVQPSGTHTAPSATGVTWPTSSTGKNYVDAAEHDDSATVNLPPSLAFQRDAPPDWWCTQSGTWAALGDDDTAFSFAYADGYLGTTHKLPAQIRYEGTTCTPP